MPTRCLQDDIANMISPRHQTVHSLTAEYVPVTEKNPWSNVVFVGLRAMAGV